MELKMLALWNTFGWRELCIITLHRVKGASTPILLFWFLWLYTIFKRNWPMSHSPLSEFIWSTLGPNSNAWQEHGRHGWHGVTSSWNIFDNMRATSTWMPWRLMYLPAVGHEDMGQDVFAAAHLYGIRRHGSLNDRIYQKACFPMFPLNFKYHWQASQGESHILTTAPTLRPSNIIHSSNSPPRSLSSSWTSTTVATPTRAVATTTSPSGPCAGFVTWIGDVELRVLRGGVGVELENFPIKHVSTRYGWISSDIRCGQARSWRWRMACRMLSSPVAREWKTRKVFVVTYREKAHEIKAKKDI